MRHTHGIYRNVKKNYFTFEYKNLAKYYTKYRQISVVDFFVYIVFKFQLPDDNEVLLMSSLCKIDTSCQSCSTVHIYNRTHNHAISTCSITSDMVAQKIYWNRTTSTLNTFLSQVNSHYFFTSDKETYFTLWETIVVTFDHG